MLTTTAYWVTLDETKQSGKFWDDSTGQEHANGLNDM
jgi:hypothetical protein